MNSISGVAHRVGAKVLAAFALVAALTGAATVRADEPLPKDPPRKESPSKEEVSLADGFPLPPGAVHRFGNRQLRHPSGITVATVSPDGKLLATGSYGGVVVWDLKTLAAKRPFPRLRLG